MPTTEVKFTSDMQYNDAVLPTSITVDLPFEVTKAVLSNKPLRRRAVDLGAPFNEAELVTLQSYAKANPLPDEADDEDLSGLR